MEKTAKGDPERLAVETVSGRALPLRGHEIDTDRIMPARYLRCVTFEGLEDHVFEDDREQASGQHPFDDSRFKGAGILIVNRNFGCGSSREHAPQGLMRRGIQGIVGESFAEIFFGNCVALGIPCLTLPAAQIEELQSAIEEEPGQEVVLDIRDLNVCLQARGKDAKTLVAHLPVSARESFLGGTWDAAGLLQRKPEDIKRVADALPYVRGFS
jgi:3-isopropylmalate/(R)-2-methylmalate dehydratase small subunit